MRLGPKEKQILKKLVPGEFTPPSVYMPGYGSCPSCCHTLNSITSKGLAVFRWETQTTAERRRLRKAFSPGRKSAEYNAALKPTKMGEEIIASLRPNQKQDHKAKRRGK